MLSYAVPILRKTVYCQDHLDTRGVRRHEQLLLLCLVWGLQPSPVRGFSLRGIACGKKGVGDLITGRWKY